MSTPQVQPLKIAILAMGGEGGGVLADWIVQLGESQGYLAQTTSVPGVAQRTGATIYYVELFPEAQAGGRQPVLALMPLPGDVDVVLASELMEAGRAVQRGLVSAERTTLITSTHRVYSMTEKMAPADGRVDSSELQAHVQQAAQRCIAFDMAQLAQDNSSVISAVLFGALAGAGVLPFSRSAFERTIEGSGIGVHTSLQAFDQAYARAQNRLAGNDAQSAENARTEDLPSRSENPKVQKLLDQVHQQFPLPARRLLIEGLRRLIDYQDVREAQAYLQALQPFVALDSAPDAPLLQALARHLALWRSYEDTFRVAQLKTRAERFERVRNEAAVQSQQLMQIDEFLHPRPQEIADMLPARWGQYLMGSPRLQALLSRWTGKGRVLRTTSLRSFVLLWTIGRLRVWRRASLRHQIESGRIQDWLSRVQEAAHKDQALALEIVLCQQLLKGYSDTFERGLHKYLSLLQGLDQARLQGQPLRSDELRRLRLAALADESDQPLQQTLHALRPSMVQH